jgi:hypothetical protein
VSLTVVFRETALRNLARIRSEDKDLIESTFATVRLRTKVTKGHCSRGRRPGHGVQTHRVRPAPLAHGQHPAPGRPGPRRTTFTRGQLVERPGQHDAAQTPMGAAA